MNTKVTQEIIELFEEKLKRYQSDLEKNPGCAFYTGLVKNTEEYLEKINIKYGNENSNGHKPI